MTPPPLALLGFDDLTVSRIAWAITILVGSFVASIALVAVLLVQLPATYFLNGRPPAWWDRHPALRWSARIVKNLLGVVLVGMGILMLIAPGQGVLTILLGIMLMDFPGKRRLERKLIGRPPVLRAVNRLRARFGRPPVILAHDNPPGP